MEKLLENVQIPRKQQCTNILVLFHETGKAYDIQKH